MSFDYINRIIHFSPFSGRGQSGNNSSEGDHINRQNYEEYFILYMDHELGKEDRRRVEEFIGQNPDLKEELEILLQSKFTPDTAVVFNGKDELMKLPGNSFINLSNYEEWLVMYLDRELTPEQGREVELFAAIHPHVQRELKLFRQTRLDPEAAVVFPGKSSLYRREEKVHIIRWWRVAAAAILFIAVGLTAVLVLNKKASSGIEVAQKTPVNNQKINAENPAVSTKDNNEQESLPVIANSVKPAISPAKRTNNIVKDRVPKNVLLPAKNDEPVTVKNDQKPSNNLPQPLNNTNLKNDASNPGIANVTHTDKIPVTNFTTTNPVTIPTQQPLNTNEASSGNKDNPDVQYASLEEGGKNKKNRGFFRKAVRFFEKKTNINATDDDRLLVGGLAIKLK